MIGETEKLRRLLHPWRDYIFYASLVMTFSIYGIPIAICLMPLSIWACQARRRGEMWVAFITAPFAFAYLIWVLRALIIYVI